MDYYLLLCFSLLGALTLIAAENFLMIFLSLEMMSIPIYCLVGMIRFRPQSGEGALKYLILGAFASAFLLYGIALVYGATGTTNFKDIFTRLSEHGGLINNHLALIGMLFLLIGLGFKIALVPFHMWTPDAYEGAPSFITGFMATAVKAAGFAALVRLLMTAFNGKVTAGLPVSWEELLPVLAVATMFVGNLTALVQKNIKRMLAYSSIAHAGYALVGLAAAGDMTTANEANASVLYYLFAYTLMTLGAFAVVCYLEEHDGKRLDVDDYKGLAEKHPALALAMAVFMFSLAGIPPMAGFFGKLYVFRAAIEAGLTWLAIIGVINSLISVYYYLSVSVTMYMYEPAGEFKPLRSSPLAWVVGLTGILTIWFGIFSRGPWEAAMRSVASLLK
jgi:NADH-quinone oxidoreductase subunit N